MEKISEKFFMCLGFVFFSWLFLLLISMLFTSMIESSKEVVTYWIDLLNFLT